jgi:Uncharacterized protein conserved in bacteria
MENPQGSVDVDLANAVVYNEPLDHLRARASYLPQRIDVPMLEVVSGPSRLDATARYDHPAATLETGELQFRVNSNRLELARIRNLQNVRPGLSGILQIAAAGSAAVSKGTPQILFHDLNADIGATGIAAQGKNFGDLTLKAQTTAGVLNFSLDSNLAGAALQARGNARLTGDYPITADVNFKNVLWSHVQQLLGPPTGQPPSFDALTEGQLSVRGPATKTDQLTGSLQIARLEVNTLPRPGENTKPVAIRNQGPIVASLNRGAVHIDSAHLVGPQTDVNATGTVSWSRCSP